MLLFLLAACIENSLGTPDPVDTDPPIDLPDTDVVDTDVPADTDVPEDTDVVDTDVPEDTDVPVDTDVPEDTDEPEDTDVPGPDGIITVSGTCGTSSYPYTSWSDPAAVVPELHVIGLYESDLGSPGPAKVAVRRSGAMVLALTSYEPVDWQVDLGTSTGITEILVGSYAGTSTVTFTTSTTAPYTIHPWIGACGYEIPDMSPTSGCETPDLQKVLEFRTGLAMSSFQGCYAGGSFLID